MHLPLPLLLGLLISPSLPAERAALRVGGTPLMALRDDTADLVKPVEPLSSLENSERSRRSPAASQGHMSLTELLKDYGVVALGFHFTVWVLTVALTFTALSLVGTSLLAELPAWMPVDAEAGVGAGKVAITFGIVEAIGPARLALTVAATPSIAARLQKVPIARLYIRRAEVAIESALSAVMSRLPSAGKGSSTATDSSERPTA